MFTLRFDMRAPAEGAPIQELYAAALDMAAWAEQHGCVSLLVSEHHGSSDGYLPSPLILAAGMAGRTRSLPIQVAALLVPLHDPIDLAEQMAVLDLVSGGRISYVCAIGYRAEEYAMFGRDMKGRGRRLEECIEVFRSAWKGEPFVYQGQSVCVTPAPLCPGGPSLLVGGNSPAAARRAGRLGLGMLTQGGNPSLERVYLEACRAAGNEPGLFINPPAGTVMSAFVARDPERAWREMGSYLLHDARMYAKWLGDAGSASKSVAGSVDELRAEQGAYRIFTPDEAIEYIRASGIFLAQPLCGGLPPELGWQSLELLASEVLPAVRAG
jgi:alkanesulfonate monooxygenase SsuD/methylene tetrahydromethanopterin reductase-like flavin-dependent oxidoreductase (luciferase family)